MTSFDEPALQQAMRHEAALRRLAIRLLGDPADVDDTVQHALLQEARGRRRPDLGLWPFLCAAVRHHAANLRKLTTRRRHHETAAAQHTVADSAAAPDELMAREQLRRRVADAVLGLDEPYRTTVWLRWFEALDTAQVAARMSVPVATVRTRLQRAHERLRRRLDADYGDRRWALLVALPAVPSPAPILSGALVWLMAKKLHVAAAAVLASLCWLMLPEPAAPAGVPDESPHANPVAADAVGGVDQPHRHAIADARPDADVAPVPSPRVFHADGRPARGLEIRWWTAADRPGWTHTIDPDSVRAEWPHGMGAGRSTEPWQPQEACSGPDGLLPRAADLEPVAITFRIRDGLWFSADCDRSTLRFELPELATLEVTVADGPSAGRWSAWCMRAWHEPGEEEPNHGYACENVVTGSGPGVLRWDGIRFDGTVGDRARVLLPAHRLYALDVQGRGFAVGAAQQFVTAPGAVTFACERLLPQLHLEVREAGGRMADVAGMAFLVSNDGSNTAERLLAGRASLNLDAPTGDWSVHVVLADLTWLQAPGGPTAGDRTIELLRASGVRPIRVTAAGEAASGPQLWIERRDGAPLRAYAVRQNHFAAGSPIVAFVDGDALLNCLPDDWTGGHVITADGRIARFERVEPGATVRARNLPAGASHMIDLARLSRETGDPAQWLATLEVAVPAADGREHWRLLRQFHRAPRTDHPMPMTSWPLHLPVGWQARLTLRGGADFAVIRQELFR